MKKLVVLPALLTVCSVISVVVYRSPIPCFNLFLSIVLLCMLLFSRDTQGQSRLKYSALWLLLLELAAFALLLFGVDFYQMSIAWLMYAVLLLLEIFVTPRLGKEQ